VEETFAMLLCIDIGNTNIKLGLFDDGEQVRHHWRIATERSRLEDEYVVLILSLLATEGLKLQDIDGCAISSVVPGLTEVFSELAARYLKVEPLVLRPETQTGMRVNIDYPAEAGPDLIANALAARHLYGAPVIVVSFGTATTFFCVSRNGNFEGVAIAPGILTSSDSLFRATATLPQVALSRPPAAIGKNTIHSLQSGLIYGFTGLVKALVTRFQNELGGDARVIATGGLASLIAPETNLFDAVEPDLALIGLRLVYQMNRETTRRE
jgi:type III pantothenate kinase